MSKSPLDRGGPCYCRVYHKTYCGYPAGKRAVFVTEPLAQPTCSVTLNLEAFDRLVFLRSSLALTLTTTSRDCTKPSPEVSTAPGRNVYNLPTVSIIPELTIVQANAIGRSSKTVREFLEKNHKDDMSRDDTIKLTVKSLLEVVQTGAKNIEISVMESYGKITVRYASSSPPLLSLFASYVCPNRVLTWPRLRPSLRRSSVRRRLVCHARIV